MEQNNELIKEVREAYAKEVGWPSFASMASNVNIVPRDISEIAKRYAGAVNAELQAKVDRYEAALNKIINTNHDNYEKVIHKVKALANEALSAGKGKEVKPDQKCQCIQPAWNAFTGRCLTCGKQ